MSGGQWVAAVKHRWMDRQVYRTLEAMSANVNADLEDDDVVSLARRLAVSGGLLNQYAQALAIRAFLKSVWRFVDDPLEREYLRKPRQLADEYREQGHISGDCDEAATMAAALAKCVGIQAQFTILAFPVPEESGGDVFSHVYATALTDDGREVDFDITRPPGPVPEATRHETVTV